MSRPLFKGIVFGEGLDLIIVEFDARQDAECVAGAEERDRDHEGAGELEGVALGEGKILQHLRAPSLERANSRSMAPQRSGSGRDHRKGEAGAAAAC